MSMSHLLTEIIDTKYVLYLYTVTKTKKNHRHFEEKTSYKLIKEFAKYRDQI